MKDESNYKNMCRLVTGSPASRGDVRRTAAGRAACKWEITVTSLLVSACRDGLMVG